MTNPALNQLLRCLELEPIAADRFLGRADNPEALRIFGGLVLAQAMRAANATVDPVRPPHSQHAYFLHAGDPAKAIEYQVHEIRDGGSFSTRRVVAMQDDAAILNAAVSFQVLEQGLGHQSTANPAAGPDGLQDRQDLLDQLRQRYPHALPVSSASGIEYRPVDPARQLRTQPREPRQQVWMRASGPLAADQNMQRALLAYMSDSYLLSTALRPHGRVPFDPDMIIASLDHALWIHTDVDCSDWLLYDMDSPIAAGGRGLSRGTIYSRDGRLLASSVQESLMRERRQQL